MITLLSFHVSKKFSNIKQNICSDASLEGKWIQPTSPDFHESHRNIALVQQIKFSILRGVHIL